MSYRLLLAFLLAGHITGCASSKVGTTDDRYNAELQAPAVKLDSTAIPRLPSAVSTPPSTEKSGLLRRLFPAKSTAAVSSTGYKKCKGCTINYVQGNQSNSVVGKKSTAAVGDGATSTVTGKKSGPAVIASDSVDQNTAGPNSQQTTTTGNGNQVDAKKQDTTKEAPGVLATIADNLTGPLGWILGGVVVLVLISWYVEKKAA
ncbi:hypothetical protein [Hymenobacter ruber]